MIGILQQETDILQRYNNNFKYVHKILSEKRIEITT